MAEKSKRQLLPFYEVERKTAPASPSISEVARGRKRALSSKITTDSGEVLEAYPRPGVQHRHGQPRTYSAYDPFANLAGKIEARRAARRGY